MPSKTVFSTLVVFGLAALGFAYVALSGAPRLDEFDYARFERHGAETAPVRVAIIEDLRCPGCRKAHVELWPDVLQRYRSSGDAAIYHVPYPVVRRDSMALSVIAASYARYHDRPMHEVTTVLFRADAPRLTLDEAEALLASRYGPIDPAARPALEQKSEAMLTEGRRHLSAVGIASTPTVIVDGLVLEAPKAAVLAEHIERALARARARQENDSGSQATPAPRKNSA